MKRHQILNEVKVHCIQEYLKITNWVHDLEHIKTVVKNGRKLCQMEEVRSKTTFLVELACWLHDLGRVEEEIGLEFLQSNHAEVSYQLAKKILKPYERVIGRESIFKVLLAVREHNLPQLRHPENRVAQLLQDADRGAGLRIAGVFTMLGYLGVIQTENAKTQKTLEHENIKTQEHKNNQPFNHLTIEQSGMSQVSNLKSQVLSPIYTNQAARKYLPALTQQLIQTGKVADAIEKLSYFKDWYYGSTNQGGMGIMVSPLHTDSARILYKKGIEEIEEYLLDLEKKKAYR